MTIIMLEMNVDEHNPDYHRNSHMHSRSVPRQFRQIQQQFGRPKKWAYI